VRGYGADVTTTPEEPDVTAPAASAEQAVLDEVEDVVEGELAPQAEAAMDALDHPRRLLLVHAHPDDESINNGATMAKYAAEGVLVTLVTCTRGELGEVIPPDLGYLEKDPEALAERRTTELAAAMEALGVTDHRFLGSPHVRFRDSGMVYDERGRAVAPPDMDVGAFAHVPVDEAASHLEPVIRQVRPQVVVTYEPGGGYGHPDHVHAHKVAMRAVELAADGAIPGGVPWRVSRVFWTVAPRTVTLAAWRELASSGVKAPDPDGPLPSMVVDDDEVTTVVDASRYVDAKAAALRAHATQVVVTGSVFGLSNGVHQPLTGIEHYQLAGDGQQNPGGDDLFAGLV
jgi:N-acetyl-1-D-myo-inositol-2-amino-2-deoxy-alpha-D-glucopyranoside deacetylase